MTSGHSQVILRSVSGQSHISLRSLCPYFVRQTEPKILRLVTSVHQLKVKDCQKTEVTRQ